MAEQFNDDEENVEVDGDGLDSMSVDSNGFVGGRFVVSGGTAVLGGEEWAVDDDDDDDDGVDIYDEVDMDDMDDMDEEEERFHALIDDDSVWERFKNEVLAKQVGNESHNHVVHSLLERERDGGARFTSVLR